MISGFNASNIGQYGIADFSFAGISRPLFSSSYVAPADLFAAPGATAQSPYFDNPVLDALEQIAAAWFDPSPNIERAVIPGLRVPGVQPEAPVFVVPSVVPEAVVPIESAYIPETSVINPEYETETTIFEEPVFEEGLEWLARTADTDWQKVYDEYVVLNEPEAEEVFEWLESATTLGQLGTTVGLWGGDAPPVLTPMPAGSQYGPPMPAKVTVDTRTGKITKCKRRRRRKLLTESDFNVLLRVATLPNKENVRIVLGKAIGRS